MKKSELFISALIVGLLVTGCSMEVKAASKKETSSNKIAVNKIFRQ